MSRIGFVLLDRYKFVAELGRDEHSVVYLAQDSNLSTCWAVKEYKNASALELNAFKKEAMLLASLSNPHIPRVVDSVQEGSSYFVVMDFVGGYSLAQKVSMDGSLPEEKVVEFAKEICMVLDYLHAAKKHPIIFRNLKPNNVMLTSEGNIKLVDFAAAIECRKGRKVVARKDFEESPYVAPEQQKGQSNILDERTDIFSLGATMFFLITGQPPEKNKEGSARFKKLAPVASEGLEYIVEKCTEGNPDQRYNTVKEVYSDLEDIKSITKVHRKRIKKRLAMVAVFLVFSLAFASLGVWGFSWVKADQSLGYDEAMQAAARCIRDEDFATAAEWYERAIAERPQDRQAYYLLFAARLPKDDGTDDVPAIIAAIDQMRENHVENIKSQMYHDPQLMYMLVKYCVQVQEHSYAHLAQEYIILIKNSREYKDGRLPEYELRSYEVFASFFVHEANSESFYDFNMALVNFEYFTDTANLSPDEKLDNFYTLIKMYSRYLASLENAPEQIHLIGNKTKKIMEASLSTDEIAFASTIRMYETVARAQYSSADLFANFEGKMQAYKRCIGWFSYLQELDADLGKELLIKNASAHKLIFDLFNTPQNQAGLSVEAKQYLEDSIVLYNKIIEQHEGYLEAYVGLAQAYIDKELIKQDGDRDFSQALETYKIAKRLKTEGGQHSTTTLVQFAVLTRQLEALGLEASV